VLRICPVCRIRSTAIVGRIEGIVMFQTRCQRPAPSMIAASYCSWSTPASAARKMIVPQPVFFQTSCMRMSGLNQSGSASMLASVPSTQPKNVHKGPLPMANSSAVIETTTVHDRKCGM
jgi:hypothetical protein